MPAKIGATCRRIVTGWPRETRLAAVSIVVAFAATAVWLWWLCLRSDAIPFLPRRAPAEWIVYPLPPNLSGRGHDSLRVTYTGSFDLDRRPDSASLRVSAWQRATIRINGAVLPTRLRKTDWKRVTEIDASSWLRRGTNHLAVTVVNEAGPPALWLSLTSPAGGISTDATWQVALEGQSPRPVRLASARISYSQPGFRLEQTWPSLLAVWPLLGVFAAIALAIFVLGALVWRLAPSRCDGRVAWPEYLLLGGGILLWGAMFWNNAGQLYRMQGFDAGAHLDYIQHILDGKGLPRPDEGGENMHPPLYYAVAAGILRTCNLTTKDDAGIIVLRYFSLLAAVASLVLLYASLARIFPSNPQRRVIGWLTGAFLPAQLYQYQFVTDEILVAALGMLSIYLALRVLQSEDPSPWACAALGASLGLTVLAKVSGVIVAAVVFALLLGVLIVRRRFLARCSLKLLAVPLCVFLAVCGWHFVRVAYYVGSVPLTTNDIYRLRYWQDPGYRVAESYWRLERALNDPLLCGFDSVADGLYSTLWGDGEMGGVGGIIFRPPWNYQILAAGYLLALLPMAAVCIGGFLEIIAWLRRPRSEGALILGLTFGMGLAMFYMSLHLAMWCSPKAVYGLSVVICLAVFAARGADFLAGQNLLRQALVYVALGTWVLASYASYWIVANSSQTLFYRAVGTMSVNTPAAIGMLERARKLSPSNGNLYYALGLAYELTHETDKAQACFEQALRLLPDHTAAAGYLGLLAMRKEQVDKAIACYELSLRIDPDQPGIHNVLGFALAMRGRFPEAVDHFDKAISLQPDFAAARQNLRWAKTMIRPTIPPSKP